jgi:lambda family phage portal protein
VTENKTNFLEKAENFLDRGIGIFAPRREALRRIQRVGLRGLRAEQYAAAKTTRLTGPWSPINGNVNDIIGGSWNTVTGRIRQLVRDFPYFGRAVKVIVDYSVGTGILFQSRIRGTDGKLNRPLNQKIEDSFNFWADKADVAKKLHYYEIMRLEKTQDVEAGEFIVVKETRKDIVRNRYLPLALRVYEADWLTDYRTEPKGTNKISRGLEYNSDTGETIAFHFTDPDAWGKSIRVAAEDVIHGFEMLRPGQLRGISPFTPGVLLAGDLQSIMEAEIDAAKMASKWLAVVETDSLVASQLGRTTTTENNQKIESLQNAIIEYLRPGEKLNISSNPRPGDNFAPFVHLVLTMLAITTGAPYELLSGDYSGMNYSTGRTKRNDFAKELRPISMRHIRQFCMPTAMAFFEAAVMSGKLDLPGFFTLPTTYLKTEWQPPGMESVDPLRETKAWIDQVANGFKSPQEIVQSYGRNLEDVYNEIAEAKEMAEERKLDFGKTSTALANNPAAIDKETEEKDEEDQA